MTTREWSDWCDGFYIWLQSVYVEPRQRRIGVFRTLLEAVLESSASDPDAVAVRLYHEHDNRPAIRTYESLGFSSTGYAIMERRLNT